MDKDVSRYGHLNDVSMTCGDAQGSAIARAFIP